LVDVVPSPKSQIEVGIHPGPTCVDVFKKLNCAPVPHWPVFSIVKPANGPFATLFTTKLELVTD